MCIMRRTQLYGNVSCMCWDMNKMHHMKSLIKSLAVTYQKGRASDLKIWHLNPSAMTLEILFWTEQYLPESFRTSAGSKLQMQSEYSIADPWLRPFKNHKLWECHKRWIDNRLIDMIHRYRNKQLYRLLQNQTAPEHQNLHRPQWTGIFFFAWWHCAATDLAETCWCLQHAKQALHAPFGNSPQGIVCTCMVASGNGITFVSPGVPKMSIQQSMPVIKVIIFLVGKIWKICDWLNGQTTWNPIIAHLWEQGSHDVFPWCYMHHGSFT